MLRLSLITFLWSIAIVSIMGQAKFTVVFDGPLSGGVPKGVEIQATADVDLSQIGIALGRNGGGTADTADFRLEGNALDGEYIYVASDSDGFFDFFGFYPHLVRPVFINGDDALELYFGTSKIDVFGDPNTDGTGEAWEYLDGWAARVSGTDANGTFVLGDWTFSGPNALDGETSNQSASNPVPIMGGMLPADYDVTVSSNKFEPQQLVIDKGQSVRWTQTQGTHNVNGRMTTFSDNTNDFYSGAAAGGNWTYEYTFNTPGYNNYQCDPHAGLGMNGTVMVREEGDKYVSVENNVFVPADITIGVDESVVWTNVSGNHNVNGDQTTYPDNPESFGNSIARNWTWKHTFTKPGKYNYQCDPHVGAGMVGTITVVDPNAFRLIAEMRANDADGVPVLGGQGVRSAAVVHGVNLNPAGVQFTVIDATSPDVAHGVGIYNNSNNLGYTVNEGDLIEFAGTLGHFNGFTQVTATEITVLATSPLMTPREVTSLGEDVESLLLIMKNMELVDATQWPDAGSSANVDITDGTNTFTLRIDNDVNAGPVPTKAFDVIGLCGQYDTSTPYDEGYQLMPRYAADIMEISAVVELEDIGVQPISPNPVLDFAKIKSTEKIISILVMDVSGRIVQRAEVQDFQYDLDMNDLHAGSYMINVVTEKGRAASQIIKK